MTIDWHITAGSRRSVFSISDQMSRELNLNSYSIDSCFCIFNPIRVQSLDIVFANCLVKGVAIPESGYSPDSGLVNRILKPYQLYRRPEVVSSWLTQISKFQLCFNYHRHLSHQRQFRMEKAKNSKFHFQWKRLVCTLTILHCFIYQ